MYKDNSKVKGLVIVELRDELGNLKSRCVVDNLITSVGDQLYAARGSGIGSPPASPTGMKLGSGSTAVSKSGAGAALDTYLADSNKAFDAGFPTSVAGVVTYKRTYAAGEATTANPITEAVIVNDSIAGDTTSPEANTISRVLIAGIGSKGAQDSLTIIWTHTLVGS